MTALVESPVDQLRETLAHLIESGPHCRCTTCARNHLLLTAQECEASWAADVAAHRLAITLFERPVRFELGGGL